MVELSVIIQEHSEGKEFIDRMISQVSDISIDHETIFVTSMRANEFIQKYGPFDSMTRVIGAYINVFDEDLWDHIEKLCIKEWGKEIWEYHLNIARAEFSWLRNKMSPMKNNIDEDWFLRRSTA